MLQLHLQAKKGAKGEYFGIYGRNTHPHEMVN
jgi:hypothetical protein